MGSHSSKGDDGNDDDDDDDANNNSRHRGDERVSAPAPAAAAPISQPIVHSLPEPTSEFQEPLLSAKEKPKKLTKGGGKLLKKNR